MLERFDSTFDSHPIMAILQNKLDNLDNDTKVKKKDAYRKKVASKKLRCRQIFMDRINARMRQELSAKGIKVSASEVVRVELVPEHRAGLKKALERKQDMKVKADEHKRVRAAGEKKRLSNTIRPVDGVDDAELERQYRGVHLRPGQTEEEYWTEKEGQADSAVEESHEAVVKEESDDGEVTIKEESDDGW